MAASAGSGPTGGSGTDGTATGAIGGPPADAHTGGSPGGPARMYPGLAYQGPPPTTPPRRDWRPPRIVEPAQPRRLPVQDHIRIDEEEARARTLTRGIGIVVGAILIVVLCALCGREVF